MSFDGNAPPPPPPPPGGSAPPPPPPGGYTPPPPPPSYQGAQYQPAQPPKSGGNRTLVIVLVIVGVLLFLCIGGCVVCGLMGKKAVEDSAGAIGQIASDAYDEQIRAAERQRDAATDPATREVFQQQIDMLKAQKEQSTKAFDELGK